MPPKIGETISADQFQKIGGKVPQVGETISASQFQNLQAKPKGTGGLKGFALGVGKSVAEFGQQTDKLAEKIFPAAKFTGSLRRKVTGKDQIFSDEQLERKGTAEKVGGFAGDVASFAVPGSGIIKGGKVVQAVVRGTAPGITRKIAGLGARAATEGVGFGGVEAVREGGMTDEAKTTAAVSALLVPGGAVAKPIARGVNNVIGKIFKNAAAGISGKGTKVIETILENPEAARQGLRNQVTISQSASQVRNTVKNLAKQASDEFGENLDNLPKRLGRAPKVTTAGGKTTIKVDGETFTLSLQGLKSQLTQALRKFDVDVDPKKGTFNFLEAPLDNAESKRLMEVFNIINSWKDTTPVGFHKLSRKIRNFRKPGEQSQELNAIIDTVSKNANSYIGKRVPAAKKMLTDFSKAQDVIEALNQEFATKGQLVGGIAQRIKTERKLGTLFSGEKTSAEGLLRSQIPGGKDIVGREAGRLLGENIGRSGSAIGDFLRGAVNVVISPKLVGELAILTGLKKEAAKRVLERLQVLEPTTRATAIEVISSLFQNESPQERK